MKKTILEKNACGFSLAEALITLLIVCLITLATVPVLTKKRRAMSNVAHGAFACYWSGDKLVGKYYMNGNITDAKTMHDNQENRDGCIFTPPTNATNFVVTTVGGGGGGASGDYAFYRNTYSIGSHTFNIPVTGLYDAIVIGGGGGGGGSKGGCSDPYCGGGGSSAGLAGFKNQQFNKGETLSIVIGAGGGGKGGDRKRGDDGGASYIIYNNNEKIIEIVKAGGGGGGFGYGARVGGGNPHWSGWFIVAKGVDCHISTDRFQYDDACLESRDESNDRWNVFSGHGGEATYNKDIIKEGFASHGTRRANGNRRNSICDGGSSNAWCMNKKYTSYQRHFGYTVASVRVDGDRYIDDVQYGAGGRGDRDGSHPSFNAAPGYGVVQWNQAYGGLGGKAGEVVQLPFAKLPTKTLVFPGKGGKGGVYTADVNQRALMSGKAGENSFIKNYPEVTGGAGASAINKSNDQTYSGSLSTGGYVVGGNGELANINPTDKPIGGAGGYSMMEDNGYVNNNSPNGTSRPIFLNNASIGLFDRLVGAGAGGGGGSSNGSEAGSGGQGSSGVVFIQW